MAARSPAQAPSPATPAARARKLAAAPLRAEPNIHRGTRTHPASERNSGPDPIPEPEIPIEDELDEVPEDADGQ